MNAAAPLPSLDSQTPTWTKASVLVRTWGLKQLADRQAQELPDIANAPLREQLNRDACVALFDKIGPAVLFTHSQSGAYG